MTQFFYSWKNNRPTGPKYRKKPGPSGRMKARDGPPGHEIYNSPARRKARFSKYAKKCLIEKARRAQFLQKALPGSKITKARRRAGQGRKYHLWSRLTVPPDNKRIGLNLSRTAIFIDWPIDCLINNGPIDLFSEWFGYWLISKLIDWLRISWIAQRWPAKLYS